MGVTRIMQWETYQEDAFYRSHNPLSESSENQHNIVSRFSGKYGVELPIFSIEDDNITHDACTMSYITLYGQDDLLLLRRDLTDEEEAGQLFALIYGIFYGLDSLYKLVHQKS